MDLEPPLHDILPQKGHQLPSGSYSKFFHAAKDSLEVMLMVLTKEIELV
jgi:hypothetical protein